MCRSMWLWGVLGAAWSRPNYEVWTSSKASAVHMAIFSHKFVLARYHWKESGPLVSTERSLEGLGRIAPHVEIEAGRLGHPGARLPQAS